MPAATRTTQDETVARLNALSGPDWTVDAGPIPTEATELCSEDTAHGPGTCYSHYHRRDEPDSRDLNGACPDCAERYLRSALQTGSRIAIDVAQNPENGE